MNELVQRSMLIMPLNVPRFLEKAHTRGADAILLDLEDSVPPAEKDSARLGLAQWVASVARGGADVLVRVNNEPNLLDEDLDAAVVPGVHGIFLPKVESPDQVRHVEDRISTLEQARGLPAGSVKTSIHIESPGAILICDEIARGGERIESMSLGTDDYRLAMGIRPIPESWDLFHPLSVLVTVCKARGAAPLGIMGSVADFSDMEAFESAARRARDMGFVGAYCIHPSQVQVLNRVFSPSPQEVSAAKGIISAYEKAVAEGRGATSLKGRMIDPPVYKQALAVLRRSAAIEEKEAAKAAAEAAQQ